MNFSEHSGAPHEGVWLYSGRTPLHVPIREQLLYSAQTYLKVVILVEERMAKKRQNRRRCVPVYG